MLTRCIRVGSIRGTVIEAHFTWLVVLAVVTCLLAVEYLPKRFEAAEAVYWLLAIAVAALMFATVLLHELAHAYVANRRGLPVPRITIYMFGGASHLPRPPRTAGEEFAISAAGPAASIVIALVLLGAAFPLGLRSPVGSILFYVSLVNFALTVFNIMPGLPLDGGAILRSIVWSRSGSFSKATKVVRNTGDVFGWAAVAGAIVCLVLGQWGFAVSAAGLGAFMLVASRAVRGAGTSDLDHTLNRLTARDVMRRSFIEVPPETPIQRVVDEYMIERGELAVVVATGDQVAGILTVEGLMRVPRAHWPATPVQRAMTPRGSIRTIEAVDSAVDVMPLIALGNFSHIPVLDEGRLIGLITREEFVNRVVLADLLGYGAPATEEIEAPGAAAAKSPATEPETEAPGGDQGPGGDSPG